MGDPICICKEFVAMDICEIDTLFLKSMMNEIITNIFSRVYWLNVNVVFSCIVPSS
jgi:hypothetical protein